MKILTAIFFAVFLFTTITYASETWNSQGEHKGTLTTAVYCAPTLSGPGTVLSLGRTFTTTGKILLQDKTETWILNGPNPIDGPSSLGYIVNFSPAGGSSIPSNTSNNVTLDGFWKVGTNNVALGLESISITDYIKSFQPKMTCTSTNGFPIIFNANSVNPNSQKGNYSWTITVSVIATI